MQRNESNEDQPAGSPASGVKNKKLRVAVVAHLGSREFFGAERSLLDILAAIDRKKYRVWCVLPRAYTSDVYRQAVSQYAADVALLPYGWWSISRPSDAKALKHFKSFFQARRFDLVHVNTIMLLEPLRAARQLGIPSVVHVRELIDQDSELSTRFGDGSAQVVKAICEAADFLIANSEATLKLYWKEAKSFRLYNCVDAECFDVPIALEPGRLRVGLISSNVPKKGVENFVRLAAEAFISHPYLQFVVIGPHCEYTTKLQKMLLKNNSPANLEFTGYVPNPAEALRRVDVVLSLSDFAESFGRTIAEAMAAGRPVIAYRRGGLVELINDGIDGFLVPPSDYRAVLPLLATLAKDRERLLEMGRNGRARAMVQFSPPVFSAALNGIYQHVLATSAAEAHGAATA
jgi:glycosyltransferase involved in cell wall biosynthesis